MSHKEFLKEVIDCFEIGANRAAITMTWILAIDHLFAYILTHKRTEFNAALSKDKGVKITSVSQRDDFTEIKETKFIELCRAAGIVANDVRKILDQKLGTRKLVRAPFRRDRQQVKGSRFHRGPCRQCHLEILGLAYEPLAGSRGADEME